ncbi:DinB family protein [Microlunatus soli]|uniref:DinB superfamily protein n=1 Tax=Microlunatus soli TaxID=630515 RepID=A0A1H1U5Z3_9ACTN|nr:DinB family protein [Microlunatus soli]SDS67920.1 Protein of unknown function [Microlunatus soli]
MAEHPTEPPGSIGDPQRLLIAYLDYYRAALLAKVDGLTEAQLRGSVLPSGWTPIELIKHLTFVEQRWIGWGFEALAVAAPWGDRTPDGSRWSVGPDESVAELSGLLLDQASRTNAVLAGHPLDRRAAIGGRFADDPPTLGWIGFHLLQEYARHLGHLDVVRELIDDSTGE